LLIEPSRIYGEIGPGERIALSKLAIEKFEETGRPLRIAIDVSIWQFQTLAGQGGSNPAIRTFYYRLLRLLSTSIQPLFVFDGPHKPPFKRGKKTGQHGACVPNLLTKQLLKLFGYPIHMAPGEAEAECALLQREGIVDAVLSEDVDTLMFGCGTTLRNWSSEGAKGNKSPTHVSVYDAKATKSGKSGLDREGMVLVALMSGGDYITEGIPGCGIKVACEAARAGFGKALCQIPRSDVVALEAWRSNLAHEILTNESKHFRIKHKTLKIPADFPDREVLGYYTHPVVSSAAKIQKLKEDLVWDGEVDVQGLRLFVAEAFDWTHKIGARKFIRGLAPAMLVQKLRARGARRDSGYGDVILTAMNEMELVRAICGKRNHFSTDGIPELRLIYHPLDICGFDLDAEEDASEDYGRDGLAPVNDDDQIDEYVSDDDMVRSRSGSPTKRTASTYDPTQPDKVWVPETLAKVGVPLKVEDYEESLRDPKKFLKAKAAAKRAATKGGMPKGAMDRFVKVSKPGKEDVGPGASERLRKTLQKSSQPAMPPVYLSPTIERSTSSQPAPRATRSSRSTSARSSTDTLQKKSTNTKSRAKPKASAAKQPAPDTNPWTLSQTLSPLTNPSINKPLSQQIKFSNPASSKQSPYYISSSPPSSPLPRSTSTPRKHQHSPSPSPPPPEIDLPNAATVSRRSKAKANTQRPATPSKNTRTEDGPSPTKKISPDTHPTSRSMAEPLGDSPVARRLDFAALEVVRAKSSSPPLPSLPDILDACEETSEHTRKAVQELYATRNEEIQVSAESSKMEEIQTKVKRKKYIMPRESLLGAWKELDEEQLTERNGRGRGRMWRESQVEVLDLTSESQA
jgi:holliday junction resolvase YEN1